MKFLGTALLALVAVAEAGGEPYYTTKWKYEYSTECLPITTKYHGTTTVITTTKTYTKSICETITVKSPPKTEHAPPVTVKAPPTTVTAPGKQETYVPPPKIYTAPAPTITKTAPPVVVTKTYTTTVCETSTYKVCPKCEPQTTIITYTKTYEKTAPPATYTAPAAPPPPVVAPPPPPPPTNATKPVVAPSPPVQQTGIPGAAHMLTPSTFGVGLAIAVLMMAI